MDSISRKEISYLKPELHRGFSLDKKKWKGYLRVLMFFVYYFNSFYSIHHSLFYVLILREREKSVCSSIFVWIYWSLLVFTRDRTHTVSIRWCTNQLSYLARVSFSLKITFYFPLSEPCWYFLFQFIGRVSFTFCRWKVSLLCKIHIGSSIFKVFNTTHLLSFSLPFFF